MKDKIFGILQRVGRSFMLPIAILPVAGLFLGIGGSFTNETMLQTYGLMGIMGPGTFINLILQILNSAGNIVFGNLPIIFAMGVAIGMAKQEKAVAALAGAIAFFIMHASINALLVAQYGADNLQSLVDAGRLTSVTGIVSLQMGVFGGILVGLGVSALHNKFYKIELPQVLSFFGGTRFVPIICAVVYLGVGILMFFVWPTIQNGIEALGNLVIASGYAGTWVYGFIERALIPFGLHHVFYLPFWQTSVGGTMEVAGQMVAGAQNIFFAQLSDPTVTHFSVDATRFMAGKFPLMIFGLPGAALAMYRCAKPENRKIVGGLLISAALTSMLTGITEPIEFTFLFVAPGLYMVHCVLAGLSYMLMHILNVGVGMTFSGGLIDLTLFGIMQGNAKTSWLNVVIVGIVYFIVYYFLFSFLIKKFNLKTPGREENAEEIKLYTRADVNAKKGDSKGGASTDGDPVSIMITKGLGGKKNISDVDCCATRLRTTVFNADLVDEPTLKASGAAGVIKKGNGIQVIYGPQVAVIKSKLEDYLQSPASDLIEDAPAAKGSEDNADVKTSKEALVLTAALNGTAMPLSEVGDGVFSEGMLGQGIAIEPDEGNVYAPCDGEISMVFDTKHAIGITSANGAELLVHIGIDTVQLNGKFYDIKVNSGDSIKAGDLIAEFDMDAIKKEGYRVITPVIVTNSDDYKTIKVVKTGKVTKQDKVLEIR